MHLCEHDIVYLKDPKTTPQNEGFHSYYTTLMASFYSQGVLKLRKRVTLMVLTVSAIYGICWGTDLILHLFVDFGSYNISPAAFAIAHTLIMFNSAVNPFAYALISHRFREKMKGMICCSGSSPPATLEPRPKEMKVFHTQENYTTGPSHKE